MECIPSNVHRCNTCNKSYSTRQNLWKHNNKFHTNNNVHDKPHDKSNMNPDKPHDKSIINCNNIIVVNDTKYKCSKCNSTFIHYQSRWKHEKKCTDNIDNKLKEENIKLKDELRKKDEKLKNEVELFKTEMAAMKKQLLTIMNKQCKIHPKTLQKINNTLNNNNLNNSCNTTNNIINIVQLGNENLENVFSKNKQIEILKQRYGCLPYLIREAHLNDKYPQFKNILITNLQNNIAYKYDKITKNFIAVDKTELLNEVVGARMDDIESFFESNTDVLDEKTKSCVEQFISKMDSREGTYYDDKLKDVKLMIYNNRDKVSKELIQTLEIIV